jgi:hypothetical protein
MASTYSSTNTSRENHGSGEKRARLTPRLGDFVDENRVIRWRHCAEVSPAQVGSLLQRKFAT